MIQDLRHAFRVLLKQPSVTILAIVTIAIGVAANAAIFSVVEGVLLRPLPYPEPERLIFIRSDFRGETGLPGIAAGEIQDIRNQSKLIENIGWLTLPSASLTGDGQMERVGAVALSDELLPVLGVKPALGRSLIAKEDRPDLFPRNVMISYELWQRRYAGDPNIIGRSIEVNNYMTSVAGVLPQGFRLHFAADANVVPQTDMFYPAQFGGRPDRSSHHYRTVARLRPGVTVQQAQSEIDAITAGMIERNPAAYARQDFRLHVAGLQQDIVKPVRAVILILLGAVGFVLLIGCANVANLLLARASGRKAEIAIRAALGAGRARVIRQMLTESLALAVIGGLTGLILAQQGIDVLLYLKPDNLPRQENIALSLPVTLFALALSIVSGILFGLAPAFQTAKSDIHSVLREAGRSKTSGPRGNRIRTMLVTAQVALSLILLISATLMIRTFDNMRRLDLGFDPSNVLTLRVDYDSKTIRGDDTWRFYQRALETVKNQPGVESASAANVMPFDPIGWTDDFAVEDNPNTPLTAIYNPIMPDYFHVMRIPLSEGRDFTDSDNESAAPVVIVDRRFAQKTWPGESAIGKKLILHPQSKGNKKILEVVGVANYTRSGIQPDARPQMYVPFASDYGFFLMMAVRTNTEPTALAATLRRAIEDIGGKRPVWNIKPMNDYVAAAMAETRFALILLGLLSGVAFTLAVIGVYAVVSYSVAERMHEFAIRIAVGAQSRDILRLALTWGIAPTVAGVAIGITGAVLVSRFLRAILFNVSATDGVSYLIASAMLLSAATLACYIPVRVLALKADPKRFLG